MAAYSNSYTQSPEITPPDSLDFLTKRIRKEDDEEVIQRLDRFVYEASTHNVRVQYETEASLNYQYLENDPYTEDELAEFHERGQPPTRRNEIAPVMERLAGQFIQTRQVATFLGRNTPADDPVGQISQDYQRWIDQQNLFEFEEQDMAWDGLVGGVGWLKSYLKANELGQDQEKTCARNPFHIFLDPYSQRYDPNEDAKYICEGAWMDLEDTIELWPDKEDELRDIMATNYGYQGPYWSAIAPSLQNESGVMAHSNIYVDKARKRVRPFEVWYKRKVRVYHLYRDEKLIALPVPLDSKTAKAVVAELGEGVYAEPGYQDRMWVGVFLCHLLIHHDLSPHVTNLFPYIPFYSGRRKNGCPLALSARLVPINEAINKRESKSLALMSNKQIIAEKNAIEDPEEAQAQNARPDGYIEVREGALSGQKVVLKDNLDMGMAQLQLLQEDKDAIRRVSGQGNEAMGMPSEVRSGAGIARKQMMSNLIVTPVHNSLRRTRYLKARLSHAYMKQCLTEEIAFQITDDPNAARTVRITSGHIQAIKERIYDIVITEMKDYAVLREQQVEMLLTALPALAKIGPGAMKLGIALTELREKEGLIKLVDQQTQPPPVQPKISLSMNWNELTAEEKAFLAIQSFQSPELAQFLIKKGADPQFMTEIRADLIKTQIKEGTRATVEKGKLDLQALGTAVEGRIRLRELLDTQKLDEESPTAEENL